jgi:hypothetical protein
MCVEALLKVGGNAHITLSGDGKALEKIDILHDCPPFAKASGDTLRSRKVHPDISWWKEMACPPKLWSLSRAKGGGADRGRTGDLLNAIQALSQLSYGPTEVG